MNDDREIEKSIVANASRDSGYAIAYAILKLADAGQSLAYQLKCLGFGNASTDMGAIEGLAMEIKEGLQSIGSAINDHNTCL